MVKELLAKWLEERRLSNRPPLPQDATIYIMAFAEWADKQAAQQLLAPDACPYCLGKGEEPANKVMVRCRFCAGTGKRG